MVIWLEGHDPYFHLAVEDWFFRSDQCPEHALFLYRCSPCVIMGRFQNPWLECNPQLLAGDNVQLARRFSGGGTVYQDLGNLNFCFVSKSQNLKREKNFTILLQTIQGLGVQAFGDKYHGLFVPTPDGPRKFSGSAFKRIKDRSYHHGTVLINSDLDKLEKCLAPFGHAGDTKAVNSRRRKVANLGQFIPALTWQSFGQTLESEAKH